MSWLQLIQAAVAELDTFLHANEWRGRENEVVNLFAHRFLAAQASPRRCFRSIRQIGIEVAVRQVTDGGKQFVRKDLVLWPEEDMTAWVGEGTPAVIIESKVNSTEACRRDTAWLAQFCTQYPKTLGVSACAMIDPDQRGAQIVATCGLGSDPQSQFATPP